MEQVKIMRDLMIKFNLCKINQIYFFMFEGSNKYFQFVSGFGAFGFTFLQAIDWFFEKYEIDAFYFRIR